MREPDPTRSPALSTWAIERVRSLAWPRRRARLPGRGRLRELAADPAPATRIRRSLRRGRGRIGDDERLIGLMLIRDETDVVPESLRRATTWFDRIFVLDGTRDHDDRRALREVLDSFPEVVAVLHDEDVADGPVRDGIRQELLDLAREWYGVDNWIGLLHADEFLDQDPRPLLSTLRPQTTPTARIRLVHFFLHADDEERWAELADQPIRDRITHAMWPGVPETRFFFDTGDRDYDRALHSKVVPLSFRNGPLIDGYVIGQYNERTPEQALARARTRSSSQWQDGHYARLTDHAPEVFTPTLDLADSPFAPEFRSWSEPRPRVVHATELGLPIGDTRPTFVVSSPTRSTAPRGAELVADPAWIPTGGEHITGQGGVLDVLAGRASWSTVRWEAAMRDFRPTPGRVPNLGWVATGGATAAPAGYLDALRLVLRVLRSSRTTDEQRRTAAREFLVRTATVAAGGRVDWSMRVTLDPGRLAELRALFPSADIVEPPTEA